MDNILTIIVGIILLEFLIENFFRFSSKQVVINTYGIHKIPKVLLELANINKDNATYDKLTKEEQEKYLKVLKKYENAVGCCLTYFRSHNLIHINKGVGSYFYKVSNDNPYLIYEEIGELPDGKTVSYVLYRRDDGLLKGSKLIGYLIKEKKLSIKDKEEVTPLFKFPERLITRRFFNKGLLRKYKLKEDVVADYLNKDELGYNRDIYGVSIETENKEGVNFWFRIN